LGARVTTGVHIVQHTCLIYLVIACNRLQLTFPSKVVDMPLLRKAFEALMLVFFVTHVPITIFVDSQALFPREWYPRWAVTMLDNFIADYKDPLVRVLALEDACCMGGVEQACTCAFPVQPFVVFKIITPIYHYKTKCGLTSEIIRTYREYFPTLRHCRSSRFPDDSSIETLVQGFGCERGIFAASFLCLRSICNHQSNKLPHSFHHLRLIRGKFAPYDTRRHFATRQLQSETA
jgi:hypothetical protein